MLPPTDTPTSPIDAILARLVAGAKSDRVRRWARRLLESGERASSADLAPRTASPAAPPAEPPAMVMKT